MQDNYTIFGENISTIISVFRIISKVYILLMFYVFSMGILLVLANQLRVGTQSKIGFKY